jgi:hypothetical protein
VTAEAKAKLQGQLNEEYADEHASVQKISVVQTTAPKYEGEATIAAYNSTFTVPLTVTSDGDTTLVTADGQKLAAGFASALQQDLATLTGKYSDYIMSPAMFQMMPASLKEAKADFVARLGVVTPIASEGRYYFGTGCAPHECGENEVAWAIDKMTGKGAAVIMKNTLARPGMDAETTFSLYGATAENLPTPLAAWADQNGMTGWNMVPETPIYQLPPK